jgi:hypothetical protein
MLYWHGDVLIKLVLPCTRTAQRLGGGYALSYESSSNVSTASNDGDEPSSAEATGGGDSAGVAAVGIADVASEQQVDVASETFTAPSTPVSKVPLQDTPSEVAAQEAVPAPAAAVSTPQSIIGTLVSSISSSAKKLPLTGEGGMLGTPTAATTAASTTSAGAADADKAAKDSNKDKEILLLKKTLKKKNQVNYAQNHTLPNHDIFLTSSACFGCHRKSRSSTGSAWTLKSKLRH